MLLILIQPPLVRCVVRSDIIKHDDRSFWITHNKDSQCKAKKTLRKSKQNHRRDYHFREQASQLEDHNKCPRNKQICKRRSLDPHQRWQISQKTKGGGGPNGALHITNSSLVALLQPERSEFPQVTISGQYPAVTVIGRRNEYWGGLHWWRLQNQIIQLTDMYRWRHDRDRPLRLKSQIFVCLTRA